MAVSSTSSSVTASTIAETVYPVMVNGYLCYSAAEVSAVKSGQSPDSVKPGYSSQKSEESAASSTSSQSSAQSQSATQVRSSQETQSQAEIQAQAQAKQLAQAQERIAQFNQLSDDQQRQQREDSRRGQLVDFYA